MHDVTPPPAPAPAPARGPGPWRWLLPSLLVALLLGLGLVARSGLWRRSPATDDDPFPLLSISDSPYLNTRPEVRYVGAETCRSCHEDRHRSFRHTGMGRSMAPVDLRREPPDATFDHLASKRRYQMRREGGKLWHRDLLLTEGSEEVLLAEYPLKYVIGSGRHSLTYATEVDGFLVESPVSWYRSRNAWGMSPGYDNPHQLGFERPVGEGCLVCHAGQSEARDGSLHRMTVSEPAIGCERCHGPGALHAEKHAGRKPSGARRGEAIDYTIVNPARLSREL